MTRQDPHSIPTALARRGTAIAVIAAAALLAAGCSLGPLGTTSNDLADPGVEPEATESIPAEPVITPAECVIGTWQVDNASFEQYLNALAPTEGARMAVSGASLIRFDGDGTFSSWREDFTFTITAEGQTVTHVSNSGETGEYGLVLDWGTAPTTDHLWVAETMVVVTDEVMNVGGVGTLTDQGGNSSSVELFSGYKGEIPKVEGREAVEGSLPFTCSGDTLEFEFDAGQTMPYHRINAG